MSHYADFADCARRIAHSPYADPSTCIAIYVSTIGAIVSPIDGERCALVLADEEVRDELTGPDGQQYSAEIRTLADFGREFLGLRQRLTADLYEAITENA